MPQANVIRKKKAPKRNIGVTPTIQQKLIYVANNLGLDGIKDMQGSTVNLYDTLPIATATGRTNLEFFANPQRKSLNFSNFQSGALKAGETLVIEEVAFLLLVLSAADLTADTTAITDVLPLSMAKAGGHVTQSGLSMGIISVDIANSTVTKQYLGYEQNPPFNPKTTGIALGTIYDGAAALVEPSAYIGQSTIKMEAPPVVPPNNGFTLTYSFPPIGTVTGNLAIMCIAGRFGSIFAGKTTY